MPTLRKRHSVTETPDVEAALEDAATKWPEHREDRARLLRDLINAGHDSIRPSVDQAVAARREKLIAAAGTFAYPAGYLSDLRDEWPV
jgi:hypothetical protein